MPAVCTRCRMDIKVLGTSCCNGKNTTTLMEQIDQIAKAKGVSVTLAGGLRIEPS